MQNLPQVAKKRDRTPGQTDRSLERHNTHAGPRGLESTIPEPTRLARAQGIGDTLWVHISSPIHTLRQIPILFFHQSRAIRGKELPKMHSKIQSQGVGTLSSTSPFFKLRLATSYMGEVMAPFTGLAPVTGSESLWPTLNLQWQTPATLSHQVRCGHWPACCA